MVSLTPSIPTLPKTTPTSKANPNDFATILTRWMVAKSFNRKTVAELAHANEKEIVEWERGLARPTKQQLTRLVRSFSLFAKAKLPSDEEIAASKATVSIRRTSDIPLSTEKAEEVTSRIKLSIEAKPFHEALQEFLTEERLTYTALADIMEVSKSAVHRWLHGAVPPPDKYKALLDLAPVLKGAIPPQKSKIETEKTEKIEKVETKIEPPMVISPPSEENIRTVDNAVITIKLLAAARRSPIRLPAMISQWKPNIRFVHDHAVKRFRQRYLEGTGRGYSTEECVALIDQLVEEAFQLGHFELLRDRKTNHRVICVGVPSPRAAGKFFGFIVHLNHPASRTKETIVTCRPALASFNQSEIRVNQPFVGFAEEFAELRNLLRGTTEDTIPTFESTFEEKPALEGLRLPRIVEVRKPIEAPKAQTKEPSSKTKEPSLSSPFSSPSKVEEQPSVLQDPVKAINTLVLADDRIGLSHDEAEIAFAYALAMKNLRIQQESLLVVEKVVEALKEKVKEAQAEVAGIHSKLEAI